MRDNYQFYILWDLFDEVQWTDTLERGRRGANVDSKLDM